MSAGGDPTLIINDLARTSLTASAQAAAMEKAIDAVSGEASSTVGKVTVSPGGEIRDLMLRDSAPALGPDRLREAVLALYVEAAARANKALTQAVPPASEAIAEAPPAAVIAAGQAIDDGGKDDSEFPDGSEFEDATVDDLPADPIFDPWAASFGGPPGTLYIGEVAEILKDSPFPPSGALQDPEGFEDTIRRKLATLSAGTEELSHRVQAARGKAESHSMVVTVTASGSLENVVFGSSIARRTPAQIVSEFQKLYREAVDGATGLLTEAFEESGISDDVGQDMADLGLDSADLLHPPSEDTGAFTLRDLLQGEDPA